jgi:GntR family transcriptional regulator, transcriptional repressor for pyruvate dehydrogenase complex
MEHERDGIVRDSSEIDEVVTALRAVVQKGGSIPSERELARQINVKRYQIRRALDVLRDANEIESAGARRAVANLGRAAVLARDTNPLEVIEVRMALEPALARLAAVRASPLDIARIQRAAFAEGGDSGSNDLAFHKAIAAGARNNLAAGLYFLLREIGRDARLKLGRNVPVSPQRLLERNAEHRAVAEAIAARDAEAAERAMRIHLTAVHRLILNRITPDIEAA